MPTTHPRRSGAQILIDQLRIHGVDTVFGVPGESYLAGARRAATTRATTSSS